MNKPKHDDYNIKMLLGTSSTKYRKCSNRFTKRKLKHEMTAAIDEARQQRKFQGKETVVDKFLCSRRLNYTKTRMIGQYLKRTK